MALNDNTRRSIQHHMEIRGINGETVGRVDHVEGEYLKVTKDTGGAHHWIPDGLIARVDQHVHLNVGEDELRAQWRNDDPNTHPHRGEATARHEAGEEHSQREHKTHEQRNDQQ